MWMVNGCESNDLNMNDSINLAKLLPNSPRPNTTSTATRIPPYTAAGCTSLERAVQQSGRDFSDQPAMGTSRWNPTPEQLLALEEMYRLGTKTPTADQIQQIAAQLRRFGRIEGKNVFYWFQNHKARERQKRRREVETTGKVQKYDVESLEKNESGLRRTVHEVEQTKNSVPPSSCSMHLEGFVSMHRTATIAENRIHEWSQFGKRKLQPKNISLEKQATWQTVDMSPAAPPINLINIMNTTTTATKFLSLQGHSSSLLKPMIENSTNLVDEISHIREVETLELFPLCSDNCKGVNGPKKDRKVPIKTINTSFSPNQFFEFLPLKN